MTTISNSMNMDAYPRSNSDSFWDLRGLARCPSGTVYATIRAGPLIFGQLDGIAQLSSSGEWQWFSGTYATITYLDGPAPLAIFGDNTNGIACDLTGILYVVDTKTRVIRSVSPSGNVRQIIMPHI